MSGYVLAGYGVTVAVLALYALKVVRRGRKLTRSLPEDERTWRCPPPGPGPSSGAAARGSPGR